MISSLICGKERTVVKSAVSGQSMTSTEEHVQTMEGDADDHIDNPSSDDSSSQKVKLPVQTVQNKCTKQVLHLLFLFLEQFNCEMV